MASLDPRFARSRDRLHVAVLDLARSTAADRITGSALARAAGVHRATVYQHGADPADILRSALAVELDEIRATLVDPATADTIGRAVEESADAVFAHIERHAPIYARELTAGTAGVGAMLAGHFAASIDLLIEHGAVSLPTPRDDSSIPFATTVAAAIAASTVAVVTVWLTEPEPRDRELLRRRWRAVLPPWWPGTIPDGALP